MNRIPPAPTGSLILLLLGTCLSHPAARGADAIRIETVFGLETPTGRYKHPSSFTELSNGDLHVVFFSGGGEYEDSAAAVYGSRLPAGSDNWTPPVRLAAHPFHALGNPVIWQAPNGWVWFFYVTRQGEPWSTSRITAKLSTDNARTWSDAFPITFEAGTMTRARPVPLPGGRFLLPAYHEAADDPDSVSPECTSFFLIYEPVGQRWTESNRVRSRLGNIQPAAAPVGDDHLVAFCRRGGDYLGRTDGWMVRTESRDGGRTWSPGEETTLPNPNAAVDFIRLQSGHHLLVFNDSFSERNPLTAALSIDGARTFPHRRDLVNEPGGSFSYPTAIQLATGEIQVLFTSDERTALRRARFPEAALLPESPGP